MNRTGPTAAFAAAVLAMGAARAEAPPLSREALSRCAGQVQALRAESLRLQEQNARLDLRRVQINQRSAELQAEASAQDPDDLHADLSLAERRKAHNADTLAFNAQIEQLRREIGAVNTLKSDYAQNCANRPYRRSDLEALPGPARDAMRAGMDDVQVPYLDPSAPPIP